jgi:tRNA A37 threonylcarbamoyladenosine biosynthesis protein TsaE
MDLSGLPEECDPTMLGIPDVFRESMCVIEWPNHMKKEHMPDDYVSVDITVNEDQSRSVRFTASSLRWEQKMKDLFDNMMHDML